MKLYDDEEPTISGAFPLSFKLWFAFLAILGLSGMAAFVFVGVHFLAKIW